MLALPYYKPGVAGSIPGFSSPAELYYINRGPMTIFQDTRRTVKDQKYFHNVRNSIDLRVFSWLQEKFSRFSWSTYIHDFGVI